MIDVNKILEKYLGDAFSWFCGQLDDYQSVFIDLINHLEDYNRNHPNEYLILHCLSDAHLLQRNFKKSYIFCPKPQLENMGTNQTNRRINLGLLANEKLDVDGLLTLFPKKITKYGIENIEHIASVFKIFINDFEKDINQNILDYVISNNNVTQTEHPIFNGTLFSKYFDNDFLFFEFGECSSLENIAVELSRKAENIVREEKGIPRIGEGWIAETELYYKIKNMFLTYDVINHFSNDWLGKQHFDIYFPELKLAIEYQGLQHDQPIEYFGGTEAFQKQQKRDIKKMNLCKRHSVKMIYVREGYNIIEVTNEIKSRIKEIAT